MDISIPKMDGYEVTRRLKARPDFKTISIIAFTAHAMRGDQEKAFESGCDGYISKPINVREFPEQIKVLFERKMSNQKETILIVDDNVDTVELLRKRLISEGYNTIEAYDGEEALKKCMKLFPI